MSIAYTNGTGTVTGTVSKTSTSNGTTVGALTKITVNQVTINLLPSQAHKLTVKYNARSTATASIVPAA